ncbi:MAG TPA: TOBE domain-containing protein, partial [Vicinamibacterales bacterium]|nr:TOBE domain-containing protein [Vicinamibacterales bacterium]
PAVRAPAGGIAAPPRAARHLTAAVMSLNMTTGQYDPGACMSQAVRVSARNQLRGVVEEIRVEGLLAQVRLRIGAETMTAVVTRDAVDELGLVVGQPALAIVKATEVLLAREA